MSKSERSFAADYAGFGEVPAIAPPKGEPKPFLESIFETRPKVNTLTVLAEIKAKTRFSERGENWQIARDTIGLVRKVVNKGKTETEKYEDKLKKEEKRGKKESASFGYAKIGDQRVVIYGMHWDFFAGSIGAVAGEKFQAAAALAAKEKLPFISIYSSSGVRQQENFAGLVQMKRMVNAVENYKKKTNLPHIAVLSGEVWGGISASAVPQADIKIALAGTNYGFSGPNVITAHTGEEVPKGAQSAEAHALYRNLDVIVQDQSELLSYLDSLFTSSRHGDGRLSSETIPTLRIMGEATPRQFLFEGKSRFISPLTMVEALPKQIFPEKTLPPKKEVSQKDKLYLQYEDLLKNAQRPDTEFYIENIFSGVTKLYNAHEEKLDKGSLEYPSIIAAIGKIGPQPFLIIGNQPSYYESYDGVKKKPSSPAPEDIDYLMRMLDMGKQMQLPVVYFCDTPGAKPTLEAEKRDQSGKISDAILANVDYPYPVISVVTGMLGSGGGLVTAPTADYSMMQENALACVAEPRSATTILLRKPEVTTEEIKTTLNSMSATAKDQLKLGLIDAVLPESENPYQTAKTIHDRIAQKYVELQGYSKRRLLSERNKRIRNQEGIEIKKR